MPPLATFLMTTYNGAEYLRPALDSVLAQSVDDWRLLIVDDCSKDETLQILRSYRDPRVEVLELEENGGQTAALNLGLERIETTFVARLDQDDVATPERLERQLAFLGDHPDVLAVGSWADLIDGHGNKVGEMRPPAQSDAVRSQLIEQLDANPLIHPATTFRADPARAAGGYPNDIAIAQDYGLWLALADRGDVANVPEVLTLVRQHASQTSRGSVRIIREALKTSADLDKRFNLHGTARRRWHRARLRYVSELFLASSVDRDWPTARRAMGELARGAASDPHVASDFLKRAGQIAAHKLRRRAAA
jgi:glycosyltransferase involved in cell wall biosynthesis